MTADRSSAPVRTVGRYVLLARIGEGGMGVVHLAEGEDGRRVALKALRPQVVGDDEGRQRLAREVASLRQVHSPHVAEVLDADPWGEIPFVVTRYVPGHSLKEVVRREGPLVGADLQHVATELLAAVRDVHAAGVLHRDVKPTNVVMEGRSPVLIDFGLARLAEDPRLTATGWLLGTPGYLAPEMLFGDSATPATDLHGWAATLVYAASGHGPYGGGHAMAILDRTRRGEVDLSGVPEGLRPLLAACLVVEPADRPTLADAAQALAGLDATVPAAWHEVGASPSADDGPLTLPWQLAVPEDPVTEVVAPTRAASAPLLDPTRVLAQAGPPAPVQAPAPAPRAAPDRPAWLDPEGRVRRVLVLLGVLVVLAELVRWAPYLTVATLAATVVVLRGISLTQETTWRRRAVRGPRWSDGPLAVVRYPWSLLRGLGGAVVLLGTVAAVMISVSATVWVLGGGVPLALLAAGAVGGYVAWWGPGGERVRRPAGQAVTAAVRRRWTGWTVVLVLAILGAGLWVGTTDRTTVWAPADGPPLSGLGGLVNDVLPGR